MSDNGWIPNDRTGVMRQESVVRTQVEHWEPAVAPVYATPTRHRGSTTAALMQHASQRVRVIAANVLLALTTVTVTVFAVALILAGLHIWAWLI